MIILCTRRLHLAKFHYYEKNKDFESAYNQLQIAQEYKQLYREDKDIDVETDRKFTILF